MGVKLGLSFCDKHNVKVVGGCATEVTHKLDAVRILLFTYKNGTLRKWAMLTSSACKNEQKK
jgi:hypothetical protein